MLLEEVDGRPEVVDILPLDVLVDAEDRLDEVEALPLEVLAWDVDCVDEIGIELRLEVVVCGLEEADD